MIIKYLEETKKKSIKMCYCKDIEMGSYAATLPMWWDARKRVIGIDACIALEIKTLWEKDVLTIESCCGHNVAPGYIAVEEHCIPKMIELGYTQQPCRVDIFNPKTGYNNHIDTIGQALYEVLEYGGKNGDFFVTFDDQNEGYNFILDLVSALKIKLTNL